ncbi:ATP-dependent DNA helicase chl1 [Coemansia sp. RSA 2337]|nr:ATP-dependent DNA helicase chl1 [Coemansia sp. RSA 2337]
MLDFKDATGSAIMDIEELAKEGWRRCTCPYYGDRASINGAQVVALSYNTLLLRSARQALGISLTGNVVIIDEVHNLVDTILAIHSISLGWRTMRATGNGADALNKFMQSTTTDSNTWVVSVNEFLTLAHANHINVYKIDRYLRESKLGPALCQVIPGGVVALFPSYALLDNMYRNWTAAAGIVDRIAKRRPVFVESSTSSGDVLEFYSARIKTARSTGALMLSVVGGRLSEGINFSDKLGRAVVIVGVPAVNQFIGRAICRRNDYAAIVFLDARQTTFGALEMLFDALGQPLEATFQPSNLAQSSLPTASTLPPLDAGYNDGRGFAQQATGFNTLEFLPPLDAGYNDRRGFALQATSFNDRRGFALPSIGGDNIDTLMQIITDSGAAHALAPPVTTSDTTCTPMLLLSSFEYRHDRVPLLGGFDVELTPEPPAGIFGTGRIFAPLGDGFGAEYNSAPLAANSNVAHTSLPLTVSFDAALPTVHLVTDFDTAHTLVSLGGGFSATNTLALLAADFGAAPTSSHPSTSCTAYLDMAQLPPECHKGNLWKESEDDASAASASIQNRSTSTTNDSSDPVRRELAFTGVAD